MREEKMDVKEEYETRMLEAFLRKKGKVAFYSDLYERATRSGEPRMCWKWSWWAFFGGLWYPLYRKTYLAALTIFAINNAFGMFLQFAFGYFASNVNISNDERLVTFTTIFLAFLGLTFIFQIFIGGYAPYFVIKRYIDLKALIEKKYESQSERVATMAQHGGYHQWVVWIIVVVFAIINASLLIILFAAINDPNAFLEALKEVSRQRSYY
ncbi:MAG: DUF2628 domain-containing protein [Helicobacteraceae bacterium]|jgi:hypothetical protein|nr:DUF2628 domain-containing protein [Helicobacteraceae bacterium]